jgi:hypothetical protein
MSQQLTNVPMLSDCEKLRLFAFANLREELNQWLSLKVEKASISDIEKLFVTVANFTENDSGPPPKKAALNRLLVGCSIRQKGKPKGRNIKNRPEVQESSNQRKRTHSDLI